MCLDLAAHFLPQIWGVSGSAAASHPALPCLVAAGLQSLPDPHQCPEPGSTDSLSRGQPSRAQMPDTRSVPLSLPKREALFRLGTFLPALVPHPFQHSCSWVFARLTYCNFLTALCRSHKGIFTRVSLLSWCFCGGTRTESFLFCHLAHVLPGKEFKIYLDWDTVWASFSFYSIYYHRYL